MNCSPSLSTQRSPAGRIRSFRPGAAVRLTAMLIVTAAALAAAGCQRPADVASESRQYFLITLDGEKVGHAVETRIVSADTVVTKVRVTTTLRRGDATTSIESFTEDVETLDGRPVSFTSTDRANGKTVREVRGAISDGRLELRISGPGGSVTKNMAWPQDTVLTEGAKLLLKRTGLTEGATFTYTTFSIVTLAFETVTGSVGAEEGVQLLDGQATLTPVQFTEGGMVFVSYYDADFRELKSVTDVLGKAFVGLACDEQTALAPAGPIDVLALGTLTCPGRLDSRTRADPLTYRLKPKGTDELNIPTDARQSVALADDGSVLVTIAPIVQPIGRRLGYTGDDPAALEALAPATYVECDDERIVALAKQAIGDIDDAHDAARRLEAFVHTYIEPTMSELSFDSAATVYETKRGDCTEHAVLLAAMCRAVGIPAQIVTGLAYVDAGDDETPRFISHAWVRVYIGERWMHLDATSRYVDGGHIMLSVGNGNDEDFLRSAKAFGYFDIVQIITPDAVYGAADGPADP